MVTTNSAVVSYEVVWMEEAEADLDNILDYYLEKAGIAVAEDIYRRIKTQIASLKTFPYRCRPGLVTGTREYIVTGLPYRVVVEIIDDSVFIWSVVHTSRQFPAKNDFWNS